MSESKVVVSDNSGKVYGIGDFQGTYRGLSPTCESPIAFGEIEVIVTDELIKIRHATGLKIDEAEISVLGLLPISKDELRFIFRYKSEYANKSIGFYAKDIKYIFLLDPVDEDFELLIVGNEMVDTIGPTILYGPEQNSIHEKAVRTLNQEYVDKYPNGCFPTLKAGGKMP